MYAIERNRASFGDLSPQEISMAQGPSERGPAERERDNKVNRIARERPMPTGETSSKKSYGPFGRGDREPDAKNRAPRKDGEG
jgi:hypothetical protein